MKGNADGFWVTEIGKRVVGSVMASYDFYHEYINYLAVILSSQLLGFGRALMHKVKGELVFASYLKPNLLVRSSNQNVLAFYHQLGYAIVSLRVLSTQLINEYQGNK